MKYLCALIVAEDVQRSRSLYETCPAVDEISRITYLPAEVVKDSIEKYDKPIPPTS